MNSWTTCAPTVPHTARGFMRSDPGVGLGGLGLPLARACRRGIRDDLLRTKLTRFREGPLVASGLKYATYADGLVRLPHALKQWQEGQLQGGPIASAEQSLEVTAERLAPFLPCYRLPAGDAVSITDLQQALTYLPGQLNCWRAPTNLSTPRPRRLTFRQFPPAGKVCAEQVEEFSEFHHHLRWLLLKEIPWQMRGCRSFAQPAVANQIARSILGIPIDLRAGSLVKANEVTAATRLAAGYRPGDGRDALRLRDFISRRVPRVRPKNRTHEDRLGSARGAAWSVALDRALNGPAPWSRNGDDTFANGPELAD